MVKIRLLQLSVFACVFMAKSLPTFAEPPSVVLFSATSIYGIYGFNYDDFINNAATKNGQLLDIRFDNYTNYTFGDSYGYLDVTHGDFIDFFGRQTGQTIAAFFQWGPRLSFSKMTGKEWNFGIIDDVLVAGEVAEGNDFRAFRGGLGFDLHLPFTEYVFFNVYAQNTNLPASKYYLESYFRAPFISRPLYVDGQIDLTGLGTQFWDVYSRPRLLLDLGEQIGIRKETLQIGTELYIHYNNFVRTLAPIFVLKLLFSALVWI